MAEGDRNVVRSVGKAFSVLSAFRLDATELTSSQVAATVGLDRGTTYRLIHTLVELGYVRPVPETKRFRLTLKCLELGFAALSGRDLAAHAAPLLRELVPSLADAGSLGILDRGEVVYLHRVQSGLDRHGFDRRPGSRTGAYAAALGHAILAQLPRPVQVEHLESIPRVSVSERTLIDMDALLVRLDLVREQGFAVSDGENAYGLRTVAAPVFDVDARPLAAVSLTIRSSRQSVEDFVAAAAPGVRRLADDLTAGVRHSLGAIAVPRHP